MPKISRNTFETEMKEVEEEDENIEYDDDTQVTCRLHGVTFDSWRDECFGCYMEWKI